MTPPQRGASHLSTDLNFAQQCSVFSNIAPLVMATIALDPTPEPEGAVEIRAEIDEGWLQLSLRRGEFEAAFDEAKRILFAFADENELPPTRGMEAARLTVYPSQELLWRDEASNAQGQ